VSGLRIAIASGDKLGKQMQYANNINASAVIMIGEDEIKKGIVVVRNMQTGTQQEIKTEPTDGLVEALNMLIN
jgi:histidyl-tRNA synthetase